jgi:hypothetical protein
MISELKDEEILDFLMTSDFEEDYKPEELKYLLVKWRYFYRLLNGRFETSKVGSDGTINRITEELESKSNKIDRLLFDCTNKDNIIESMKNRSLTWKERFTGKIINRQ